MFNGSLTTLSALDRRSPVSVRCSRKLAKHRSIHWSTSMIEQWCATLIDGSRCDTLACSSSLFLVRFALRCTVSLSLTFCAVRKKSHIVIEQMFLFLHRSIVYIEIFIGNIFKCWSMCEIKSTFTERALRVWINLPNTKRSQRWDW